MLQSLNFNLFGNFERFEATPERISLILNEMLKVSLNVIPGTFQQVNPSLGMKKHERMQFINQKENFSILLNVDSLAISATIDDKSYNLERNINTFVSNVKRVLKVFNSMQEEFPLGSRISLVINLLHDKEKIQSLDNIFEDFNSGFPNYESDETFEWSTRLVKRKDIEVKENMEKINIVSEVGRTQGEISRSEEAVPFDTVNTMMDINTLYENHEERIEIKFAEEFLNHAVTFFLSYHDTIEAKLNGDN